MQSLKRVWSYALSFIKNDLVQTILAGILLILVIMSANSAFQLFTPSVQAEQTSFDSRIIILRDFSGDIFCNVQVVTTYRIKMPLLPIRSMNLSISNPSNFSGYGIINQLSANLIPPYFNVEANPGLAYSLIEKSVENVSSISVMPLNSSLVKSASSISLTYYDMLNYRFINATQPRDVNLENGSIEVTMSLIIDNKSSRELYSDGFPLFSVQNYGNMTSFSFLENGTLKSSYWNTVSDGWLWTALYINPHSFVNLTIATVFQGQSA